ncbi:MAG: pantoate--beta-alanine ligase [Phycisphaerales bacterium]|nr:pantoate--beta-alanine ligase [Phycisphaerales bacterium]
MQVITDPADLLSRSGGIFVPTMGALHDGHAALVRLAAGIRDSDAAARRSVLVSIFVNPTQFNDAGDLARYPRTLDADLAICQSAGADAVFIPDASTVYPDGQSIAVPRLPRAATEPKLEDALRPGHFAGVCQVVARLFDLVKPSAAVFGEKDFQQLAVVRAMVADLRLPIEVLAAPTVREADGLAMSSRNRFIAPRDRARAAAISLALCEASAAANSTPDAAERAMRRTLLDAGFADKDVQYAVIRDAATLTTPTPAPRNECRALIAVSLPPVRLIDNAPWKWPA